MDSPIYFAPPHSEKPLCNGGEHERTG